MLAKRKEEFALYQEQTAFEPAAKVQPKIDRRLRAKGLVFFVLFAALAMCATVRSERIVSEGYALVKMRAEADRTAKENDRLRLEIARLKAPQRIKQIAVSQLGMIVPEDVYFASAGE